MPQDHAAFLAGSPSRVRLLAALDDGDGTPADLAEATGIAHRSVQRNLGDMVERGWVEKRAGAYRLTAVGRLVAAEQARHERALDRLDRFEPLLGHLPADHTPPLDALDGVTLVSAAPDRPQAPIQHYVQSVEGFDPTTIRIALPVLSRLFHRVHGELAFDGAHTELVLGYETMARAADLNPLEFAALRRVGIIDLYVCDDPVGCGVTVGDGRAVLGAYDADGNMRACAAGDGRFHDWASDLYRRYREAAKPLSETDI
ncbi:helix-turn-helix transcriptional regulator [Haloarchaeobius sp. DT45]|uniref:helix-turn-helix transcriptional regulator n=1 Tax=Haloarchaeobius sp. DT45 TaxID=3446116 RepID=UPI003F6C16E6